MKENHKSDPGPVGPDDARLSALLRASRVSPPLPPRFRENVWRRIEDAEAPAKSASWLDALATLVLRPRVAGAAATALVLAGVLLGTVEGRLAARQDAQAQYVSAVVPAVLR